MGAQDFIIRQRASSPDEAYRLAVETAIVEEGHDPYNGTISTCSHYADFTELYRKSKKGRKEFINDILHKASKRDCYIIEETPPVKNSNKIKSTVEHAIVKGTSKWELRYNIYTGMDERQVQSFKTKTDAVKYAREYTEKTQNTTVVRMEKILINQNANVACIKYKKSTTEQDGQYILFGIAAC